MLVQLEIQNYAIIKNVNIQFDAQLNIITGETGAGKSIIIGALSLVLGERIDWFLFENQKSKCIIEATFDLSKKIVLKTKLEEMQFSSSSNTIILRKEINPQTKTSRNFINDNLVNVGELGEIANQLIDLHQQFDTLEIYNTAFQFKILDAVSNNFSLLNTFQGLYKDYLLEKQKLEILKTQDKQSKKDLEYWSFLYDELIEANFQENEIESLEEELEILSNAENIQNKLSFCIQLLDENEASVNRQLKQLIQQLKQLKLNDQKSNTLLERIQSCSIELEDITSDINQLNNSSNPNPKRLEFIQTRLNIAYKLFKKHQVKNSVELNSIQTNLKNQLDTIQNIEQLLHEQQQKVTHLEKEALQQANLLNQNRKKHLSIFEDQLHILLQKVGMPNAQFKILLEENTLNEFGINKIEFLLDANKTNTFKPLKKVASGGELNRLMLSIKSIVAKYLDLPTLIFDEIDTGVSGEVAKQIGEILKNLGNEIQIITITHQASIAAKGKTHFFIYKQSIDNEIQTKIKNLTKQERVLQIAEMLSGNPPTQNALAIAQEMLEK